MVKGKSFLLSNGDVVFDDKIVYEAICREEDLIAADAGSYSEESMKISLNQSGYIKDISKLIRSEDAYGNSIDVYKFSAQSSKILFNEIRKIIEEDNNLKDWTEVAIQRLMQKGSLKMKPFDIAGKSWVEIDNYHDLAQADKIFSDFDMSLKDKKIIFIDLDGTIYIGDEIIPGAREFLDHLKKSGVIFYFLSNNSSRAKSDYVQKLHEMNIETDEDKIILSTDGLIEYLLMKKVTEIYLIGTRSMEKSFADLKINTNSHNPEYVVLGYDTELTYEKLKQASIYLRNGIDLLATHRDIVCPTKEGLIPDIGSMLALIEASTGKKPEKVFGKPNLQMIEHILKRHGVTEQEVAVVGDRLYTDMELARNVGCDFICVLSGETNRDDIEKSEYTPDLIINNVGEII